ncbi:MAG: alpha/beta fold hydrolase [Candidatus Helarchaeota archaeon]
MPYTNFKGAKIYYRKIGKKSKLPPLLLIHGAFANHLTWYSQIKYFSKKTELILFDLPGHGKSTKQLTKYQLNFFPGLLKHLIKELELQKPIVVGHSLGGFIAQLGSIEYPDLMQKLILLCSGPFLGIGSIKPKIPYYLLLLLKKILTKLRWSFFCKILRRLTRKHTIKGIEEIDLEPRMAASCSGKAFLNVIAPFMQMDLSTAVKTIKIPILFITGSKDLFYKQVPFYQSLPNASVKVLEGGEHVLHLLNEKPNIWMMNFIKERK